MKPCLSFTLRSAALPAAAVALALLTSACGRDVYVTDDIDSDLDISLAGPSDSLHQPYVLGTPVIIRAFSAGGDHDTSTWWMSSSNPEVVRILDQQGGSASCFAAGVGLSTMSVYESAEDQQPLRSFVVDVRQPDRASLYAHGALIVGQSRESARDDAPHIVAGGSATFLVGYFSGDTRLYGNQVLGLGTSPGVRAEADSTFLLANQDWVRISPESVGAHSVRLSAGGLELGSVEVQGVDPTTVSRLALIGESEHGARAGQTLNMLAQAYDSDDHRVFGADVAWQLDDVWQSGFGDLFRYTYYPDAVHTLRATDGATSADGTIHASGGEVSDSVSTGCNMTPHVPDDAWVLAVSGLGALLAMGRRRG